MKRELLLGTAAVGLLITGAVAQQTTGHDGSTGQRMERIKEPAAQAQNTRGTQTRAPGEVRPLANDAQRRGNGPTQGNSQTRTEDQARQNKVRSVYPNASQKTDQQIGHSRPAPSTAQAPAAPQRNAQQPAPANQPAASRSV